MIYHTKYQGQKSLSSSHNLDICQRLPALYIF